MSDLTKDLETFVEANRQEILTRFNQVLKKHPETAGMTVAQATISYADVAARGDPTVERIEGGYIIWK